MHLSTIKIDSECLRFSAGHFVIFSASERERLHGHNFSVSMRLCAPVNHNGLTMDYRFYEKALLAHCQRLNEYFLLPGKSPYLQIETEGDRCIAHFNQAQIPFLRADVCILEIENITVEAPKLDLVSTLNRMLTDAKRFAGPATLAAFNSFVKTVIAHNHLYGERDQLRTKLNNAPALRSEPLATVRIVDPCKLLPVAQATSTLPIKAEEATTTRPVVTKEKETVKQATPSPSPAPQPRTMASDDVHMHEPEQAPAQPEPKPNTPTPFKFQPEPRK